MADSEKSIQRLLFAMLAVELDFATAEQVAGTIGIGDTESAEDLAQKLLSEGVLTEEECKLLSLGVDRAAANSVATMAEPAASARRGKRQERLAEEKLADERRTLDGSPPPSFDQEAEDLAVERDGRYDLRGVHGRGGQARVLLAWDKEIQREVAFKVMRSSGEGSQSLPPPGSSKRSTPGVIRFLREARVTGQLEHPNIVPVYEVGRRKEGELYYTMRLVHGKTLSAALAGCKSLQERLKRLGAFWDLCKAIAFAHSRGVVHRDLKPDNVMVGEFGETVLLDWGVAKVRGERDIRAKDIQKELELMQQASSGETAAGTAVGTPSYMSPEQARGKVDEIDDGSDVWGLGAVLYEVLTGRPPFGGPTPMETLHNVVHQALVPVRERCPEAPPELAAVAEKCLQKNKVDRYGSARELASEIEAYMTGAKVHAYEYSSWELARRFAAKNKPVLIAAAATLLVIVGALVSVTLSLGRERSARQREQAALAQEATARTLEHQERLAANFHLAQAFNEKADRLAEEQRFLSASVLASAALLHNPAHPKSPFASPGFDTQFPGSAQARVLAASQIYRARLSALADLVRTLRGVESFEQVIFSPDGKLLASGEGKQVLVWNAATGELEHKLEGHSDRVFGVAFSPDGKLLATSGRDRAIVIWDVARGEKLRSLTGHTDAVFAVRFSPDGTTLGSASWDHTARLWDVKTGVQRFVLSGHKERVNQLAFSPDGRRLATASHDGTVRFWSPQTGQQEKLELKHPGAVQALAFSPDGRTLATACLDKRIRIFDAATGKIALELDGHRDGPTGLVFSPDGRVLYSSSYDKTVRLWDMRFGRALLSLDAHDDYVEGLAISPDGALLATSGYDKAVKLWNVRAETGLVTLEGHTDAIYCLAFSPDGKTLASSGWDKTVRLWDLPGRKLVATLEGHTDAADGGLVFLDERRVASAGKDHTVRLWDAVAKKPLQVLTGHAMPVYGLSLSPDRKTLVSAGYDKTIRLWDAATGRFLRTIGNESEPIDRTGFSPDGKTLITAGYDKLVKLWDPATGAQLKALQGHADWVSGATFSPDGKLVASSGKDGIAILWDAASGKEIRRLLGHTQWVNDVRFSPDGKLLATCSDDTTVRVWSTATGENLLILRASREVVAAEFSPDGKTLAVGDGNEIKLYPLDFSALDADPKQLLLEAEHKAGAHLDGSELRATPPEAP